MKKLIKFLIIPLAILVVTGCGEIPTLENGQQAIITFDDQSIAVEDFYKELKTMYGKYVIMDVIDQALFETAEVTEEETKYIEEQVTSFEATAKQYGYTVEALLEYQYGITSIDDFKDQLSLSYRRQEAVSNYLKGNLTDKEINNYYKNNIYGDVEVKHILIAPETLDGMTSSEITAAEKKALQEAKDIIKKLKNGADFDELAKKYSDDEQTASTGGYIGWFNTGKMEEAFEEAAFDLKKGAYTTTPIETKYGYHIIYKVDEKDKPKLEDVKDEIIETLVANKLSDTPKLYYETLEKIRDDAGLVIEDDDLKKEYKSYMSSLIENAKSKSSN